jgi:hypothetical protein
MVCSHVRRSDDCSESEVESEFDGSICPLFVDKLPTSSVVLSIGKSMMIDVVDYECDVDLLSFSLDDVASDDIVSLKMADLSYIDISIIVILFFEPFKGI